MSYQPKNVWLGMLFVTLAGLMIALGGVLSFLIPTKFSQVLPISLAFSAGVIIYLAFIEIWPETESSFDETGDEEYMVHIYTSLTFFGGILIGGLLDKIVHCLGYEHDHHHMHHGPNQNMKTPKKKHTQQKNQQNELKMVYHTSNGNTAHQTPVMSNNASNEQQQNKNAGLEMTTQKPNQLSPLPNEKQMMIVSSSENENENPNSIVKNSNDGSNNGSNDASNNNDDVHGEESVSNSARGGKINVNNLSVKEQKELMRVSLVTAIAISLHNFPEGLATFIGTIADPAIGASIAVAVAIHNVPIGISMSTPVYYVTHSKWKAIGVSLLAGITQPIGGLIGLIVIETGLSEVGFGIMFGLTGGLMIYTCFRELLPAARYRDPTDKYTSWLVFVGFVVLDFSLILFDVNGGHDH